MAAVFADVAQFTEKVDREFENDERHIEKLTDAIGCMRSYFEEKKIRYLNDLDSSFPIVTFRLALKAITMDRRRERICIQLMSSMIKIGVEKGVIQPFFPRFWRWVSTDEWLKRNTNMNDKKATMKPGCGINH